MLNSDESDVNKCFRNWCVHYSPNENSDIIENEDIDDEDLGEIILMMTDIEGNDIA